MKKQSISFLTPMLVGGPGQRNTINLINNLDKNIYDISFVAGNIEGDLGEVLQSHVRVVNFHTKSLASFFVRLVSFLKKEKPDILVSALPHINTMAITAKMLFGFKTKIILTEHTTFSLISKTTKKLTTKFFAGVMLPFFMRWFYPLADAIVCVSEGVAQDIKKVVGNLKTIEVIYNPVVDESIQQKAKESLKQDEQLFAKERPVIIAVGRLVGAKDYPTLLRAFTKVLSKTQAKLIILGEGPEKSRLQNLANQLQIGTQVHFLGFKSNPYAYMARASVLVLSSIREGFGNVIVEAMACGTPVVATDCKSGPREIIKDGVDGLLVAPQSDVALAQAILKVLTDKNFAKKIALAGKERSEYFSVKKSVEGYQKVFARLCSFVLR